MDYLVIIVEGGPIGLVELVMRRPFAQLFSIHGFLSNEDGSCLKQVPLVFVFMTRRETVDYERAYNAILGMLPGPPAVQHLVADFEPAIWAGLRKALPGVGLRGCNFHWSQAVWRKAQDKGLLVDYNQKGDIYKTLRRMISLPYLPIEELEPVFTVMFGSLSDDRLIAVRNYIEKTWIRSKTFPPSTWCVFRRQTRTNNDCEGWHRRLNHAARECSPPFYELVPLLNKEAEKLELQRVMVEEGALKRIQRRAVRERQARLNSLWDSYDAGSISGSKLLVETATFVGPVQ